ncbi:helix-turn-helix domain-containing protein [Streptomyces coeruleorubidus]|uniref:helix-turn-helix domain-containing protein n=1 Tax=Streptomyces coeruleorubidus TaxID=116188 RepID=UPI00237F6820|nr:helix-turn-helix domain-containing protein [Streptomyces coeruleorubidus]WDV55415.1 helix-turn-helix domain-containing protein [Streptomyces coeruleorubidus]
MRSYEAESEPGWDVVLPRDGMSLDGVRMAGFRERAATGLDMRVLPRPAVVVVIGLGESPFSVEGTHGHQDLPSFAAALSPGPARIRAEGVECVEMRLSPRAAYALLGVSPRELDGSVRGLEDLWGRAESRLRERLAEASTWEQRLTLVDRFLAERAARAPAMAPEVAAVWDTIVARRGRVRVGELADACGWSRKRLWSRFSEQIGLTPKRAAMLVRFDHAARALTAGANAADVALACGYVDQPHLHRDVLAFAGCTPTALAGGANSAG